MPCPPLRIRVASLLLAAALPAMAAPGALASLALAAQSTGSPLAPRGSLILEAGGIFSQVAETFGTGDSGGRSPVGGEAFRAELSPTVFAALEREQASLRALLADPGAELLAGAFRSRLEVNDQQVPLRLGYGVLDRLSVAVTVPLVRRRVDAHLQVTGAGANVGANPARVAGTASSVVAFREGATAARLALESSVTATCADEGSGSASCLAGQALQAELQAFLSALDEAWDDLDLFPRTGSAAGEALRARWSQTRDALQTGWSVQGPETLPLATTSAASALRTQLSDPVWDPDGFPSAMGEAVLRLGDVELHAAVGLLDMGAAASEEGGAPAGVRVRSAVEGTLRLSTGEVDSFSVLTPLAPLSGHGGAGVRWITDVVAGTRMGVLVEAQWQTFSEGSGLLLAFDPVSGWNPDLARVSAQGAPGDRLRLAVTPRFLLAPGLSLGGGFQTIRTGESRWTTTGEEPPSGVPVGVERVVPSWTTSQLVAELRLSGREGPLADRLPFPVELLVQGVRSVQGSASAPVESRLNLGVRLLRRR